MAPVVRIDDDVWQWLQGLARPFEDTPNTVLRRVAGLGASERAAQTTPIRISPSARGNPMLERFRAELNRTARRREAEVLTWAGGNRRSSSVIEYRAPGGAQLLYVRTRSEGEGFWGVRASFLPSFAESRLDWSIVFLVGPDEKGYVLSSSRVTSLVRGNKWSSDAKGNFKVHERSGSASETGSELAGSDSYNSYAALVLGILNSSVRRSNER
jgi:hypothetical protein